jgi:polyisoprenoid-binding protein YceI
MSGQRFDRRLLLAFLLQAAAAAAPIRAQEIAASLDPDRTTIAFSVRSTLHTVHGTFKLKSGELRLDPATGQAGGEVVVDLESGRSGNDSRDRRMRGEILETGRFPTAVFRPDRFEGRVPADGDSQGTLHGRLEFHGAEHELLLPVRVHASAGQVTAEAKFEIPYVRWGLKNPTTLLLYVADTVQIEVETSARIHGDR